MTDTAVQPRGCSNFKLRQLLRRVARLYDAELAQAGIKTTQFSLLSHVLAAGPVQPSSLAQSMGLDTSTLTRNLRLLIDAGWVVQLAGDDARTRPVEITEAGRLKQAQARRCWKRAQTLLNERLGVERVVALHQLIDDSLQQLSHA